MNNASSTVPPRLHEGHYWKSGPNQEGLADAAKPEAAAEHPPGELLHPLQPDLDLSMIGRSRKASGGQLADTLYGKFQSPASPITTHLASRSKLLHVHVTLSISLATATLPPMPPCCEVLHCQCVSECIPCHIPQCLQLHTSPCLCVSKHISGHPAEGPLPHSPTHGCPLPRCLWRGGVHTLPRLALQGSGRDAAIVR